MMIDDIGYCNAFMNNMSSDKFYNKFTLSDDVVVKVAMSGDVNYKLATQTALASMDDCVISSKDDLNVGFGKIYFNLNRN